MLQDARHLVGFFSSLCLAEQGVELFDLIGAAVSVFGLLSCRFGLFGHQSFSLRGGRRFCRRQTRIDWIRKSDPAERAAKR